MPPWDSEPGDAAGAPEPDRPPQPAARRAVAASVTADTRHRARRRTPPRGIHCPVVLLHLGGSGPPRVLTVVDRVWKSGVRLPGAGDHAFDDPGEPVDEQGERGDQRAADDQDG